MLSDRRAKIVATIGPSTQGKESLRKAICSGMNVARLNFSHGQHADHLKVIQDLRALSKELKSPVTLLQDLQGPKIRVGRFKDGSTSLNKGDQVELSSEFTEGEGVKIPIDFPGLVESAKPGHRILFDDGLIEVIVDQVAEAVIHGTVVYGGVLKDRKGINAPGVSLPVDCLTEKDLKDLEFGIANGVDYVALSFVREGKDMRRLREIIDEKNPTIRIVAKIEMLEALDNLEEIVRLSDTIMVARGDLAIEVGQTQLPGIQKRIIKLCNRLKKPVITATQMLDSMVLNPRPTRAEITDVANAVLDGSDALMLSAESASGKYPFACIQTMHEIILEVEKNESDYYRFGANKEIVSISASIAASAAFCAMKLQARAIVCLTNTGKTATIISGFRPKARIVSMTDNIETLNKLEATWGIQTFTIDTYTSMDIAVNSIQKFLIENGLVKVGDKIVLTLGLPVEEGVKTNAVRVITVDQDQFKRLPEAKLPLRCQKKPFIEE